MASQKEHCGHCGSVPRQSKHYYLNCGRLMRVCGRCWDKFVTAEQKTATEQWVKERVVQAQTRNERRHNVLKATKQYI